MGILINIIVRSMRGLTWPRRLLVVIVFTGCGLVAAGINPVEKAAEHLPVGVGRSSQAVTCLPWDWFWLNNRAPKTVERGDMVQVYSRGLDPIVPDGTRLVKIVAAMAGDTYRTTSEGLYIHGRWYDDIRVPEAIQTEDEQIVPPGHLLVLGLTNDSFDSRYFGPVKASDVIGTARPIVAPRWDTHYDSKHDDDEEITYRLSVLLDHRST